MEQKEILYNGKVLNLEPIAPDIVFDRTIGVFGYTKISDIETIQEQTPPHIISEFAQWSEDGMYLCPAYWQLNNLFLIPVLTDDVTKGQWAWELLVAEDNVPVDIVGVWPQYKYTDANKAFYAKAATLMETDADADQTDNSDTKDPA